MQTDEGDSDDVPKPDDSYNIDIPESVVLWEARPRPANSAQVCTVNYIYAIGVGRLLCLNATLTDLLILLKKKSRQIYVLMIIRRMKLMK